MRKIVKYEYEPVNPCGYHGTYSEDGNTGAVCCRRAKRCRQQANMCVPYMVFRVAINLGEGWTKKTERPQVLAAVRRLGTERVIRPDRTIAQMEEEEVVEAVIALGQELHNQVLSKIRK